MGVPFSHSRMLELPLGFEGVLGGPLFFLMFVGGGASLTGSRGSREVGVSLRLAIRRRQPRASSWASLSILRESPSAGIQDPLIRSALADASIA